MPELKNPSVASALKQVREAIVAGAKLPFTRDALAVVPKRIRPSFEERLRRPGSWARAGRNVIAAARQLGVIATSIARLRHSKVITADIMEAATLVVQAECKIDAREGRWCTYP